MEPGRRILVGYVGEELWHERLLLARVPGKPSHWVILTPDDDMYIEDLRACAGVRVVPVEGGLPRGVSVGTCYRFAADFEGEELGNLKKEARELVASLGEEVDDNAPEKVWIVVSPGEHFGKKHKEEPEVDHGGHGIGEIDGDIVFLKEVEKEKVAEAKDDVVTGWSKQLEAEGASSTDARIMPILREESSGDRWREWKTAASAFGEEPFVDWPLDGPRTLRWLAKEMAKSGGGPLRHHQNWRTLCKADESDRAVHEHESICLALEMGGSYDQLDCGSCACFEVLARRLQLIEESRLGGGASAYEGAKFFLGFRRQGALVAPELSKHVAGKLQEEVTVMKERRKHNEERTLARTPKAAPPGKGGAGG